MIFVWFWSFKWHKNLSLLFFFVLFIDSCALNIFTSSLVVHDQHESCIYCPSGKVQIHDTMARWIAHLESPKALNVDRYTNILFDGSWKHFVWSMNSQLVLTAKIFWKDIEIDKFQNIATFYLSQTRGKCIDPDPDQNWVKILK